MSGAHEIAEKIEHAAGHGGGHGAGGHGASVGRLAGITMAILGVLLAVCAALVGGARTDLIATMVEQSNTYQKYQSQRMKHRMMITQLASLHALSPSHAELKKFQDELVAMHSAGKSGDSEDTAEIKSTVETSTKALVEILSPRKADEQRLVDATKRYAAELDAAEAWAESYDEAVEAHEQAAEHFEWGQLAAEIGIVIASVALLLSNKKAWGLSVVFGVGCVSVLAWTWVVSNAHTSHAEAEIARTKAAYEVMRHDKEHEHDDEEILAAIEAKIQAVEMPAGTAGNTHDAPPQHL